MAEIEISSMAGRKRCRRQSSLRPPTASPSPRAAQPDAQEFDLAPARLNVPGPEAQTLARIRDARRKIAANNIAQFPLEFSQNISRRRLFS
jgi:hypothetical protein